MGALSRLCRSHSARNPVQARTLPRRHGRATGADFAFAVAKGLCERNSAELTLVKKEAEKKRQRPTLDGLSTILNYSGTLPWLKRTIRLELLSLQRREDIVTWPKTAVDLERNTLKVSPGRTQNYGTPIHLEIVMGQDLREVVLV